MNIDNNINYSSSAFTKPEQEQTQETHVQNTADDAVGHLAENFEDQSTKKIKISQDPLPIPVSRFTIPTSSQPGAPLIPLTPQEFWSAVSSYLKTHPSLEVIEIEGQGGFWSSQLELLVSLGCEIAPEELKSYVARLKLGDLFTQLKDPKAFSLLNLHAILGREHDVLEDLKKGSVDAPDAKGNTALQWAAFCGNKKMVRCLIEAGADPNKVVESPPAITQAVYGNAYHLIPYLVLRGADINIVDKDGFSPLMSAIHLNVVECVQRLIYAGANIEQCNQAGDTALIKAVKEGKNCIVQLLLSNQADVSHCNKDGFTALHYAAATGNMEIIQSLLKAGAPLDKTSSSGTPLMFAAQNGRLEAIKYLLDMKANPNPLNDQNESLLYLVKAWRSPHWQLTRQMIKTKLADVASACDFAKQLQRTKLTTHAFHLKGKSEIQERKIKWEGGYSELAAATMGKSIQNFSDEYPHLLNRKSSRLLAQSFQFAVDHQSHKSEHYMRHFNQGRPLVFLSGYVGHAATIIIWKNLFIVCDRSGAQNPLVIKEFDRSKFNPTTIELLLKLPNQPHSSYIEALSKQLPQMLSLKQSTMADQLQTMGALLAQHVGNCSWAASEEAANVFMLLAEILQQEGFKLPDDTTQLQDWLNKTFTNWLLFQHLALLEKQLKSDPNPALVQKSFKILWALRNNKTSSLFIEPELLQRIDQLEANYLNKIPPATKKDFLTQKMAKSFLW